MWYIPIFHSLAWCVISCKKWRHWMKIHQILFPVESDNVIVTRCTVLHICLHTEQARIAGCWPNASSIGAGYMTSPSTLNLMVSLARPLTWIDPSSNIRQYLYNMTKIKYYGRTSCPCWYVKCAGGFLLVILPKLNWQLACGIAASHTYIPVDWYLTHLIKKIQTIWKDYLVALFQNCTLRLESHRQWKAV